MAKTVTSYTSTGKKSGTIKLSEKIFGGKINQPLLAQAVRVYLNNQRCGLAKTKRRGKLTSITTAKIWRQKGTGRARHGSRRAPIFVGGGKAHGPTGTQNFKIRLPQKMKQAALKSALAALVDQVAIVDLSKLNGKTKSAAALLKKLGQGKQLKFLIVLEENQPQIVRALGNLSNVCWRLVKDLTTYDVLNSQQMIFTEKSLAQLEKRLMSSKVAKQKKNER